MARFIIYSPKYKEDVGGVIALHKLCSTLLAQGHTAAIWPSHKPHISELDSFRKFKKFRRWYLETLPKIWSGRLNIKSPYNLPIAKQCDVKNAIVIYPETIDGNPLNARKVVRWFLNKPGALTGRIVFGADELFFYYNTHFNDWKLNPDKLRHLWVTEVMSAVYKNKNNRKREGTCYMVRKGVNRILDQHDPGAIKVDGLSHREMAEVFNRCKYFISYDLYTMYSRYAAMCGCIPIVVPEPGMTKEQWRPLEENRYGIAYGWDDIPWAVETREKLLEILANSEFLTNKSVEDFVKITQCHFESDSQRSAEAGSA